MKIKYIKCLLVACALLSSLFVEAQCFGADGLSRSDVEACIESPQYLEGFDLLLNKNVLKLAFNLAVETSRYVAICTWVMNDSYLGMLYSGLLDTMDIGFVNLLMNAFVSRCIALFPWISDSFML